MINMQKMNKKQAGFTLIELVMVIVILGILSAFALPRFADLTGNARAASIDGLAGALKSAAAIAHAQQIADGSAAGVSVTLEGAAITMIDGYPTANAAGITLAANVDTANDYAVTAGGAGVNTTITYTVLGYDDGGAPPVPVANCNVVYTSADTANSNIYTVVATTTGC